MTRPFQPTQFGRYQLTERIAIGGMAEIFYAKVIGAMGFEKAVVIKRILPQFAADAEFLWMFITEAKLVCHLEHPNVVQVHDLGEIDGQYYIAMEHVNGVDARQLWRTLAKRKQRLPGVLALYIVSEFLKGLDYAHRAVGADGQLLGVVHRDVSPSNILLSFRGDVKIGDFGIALVQQESKTQAGVLKGKFGYMSPEQVAGLKVDHRSDIFAAGVVLAELLLGRRLFLGASDFETLDKVMNVRLEVLEEHERALPAEAVRIVRQALQRDVNDRYQSAREFHEDITEHLYQQGHRLTNETLAAFMAEHVTPYLTAGQMSGESSSPSASAVSPGLRTPSSDPRAPVIAARALRADPAELGALAIDPAAIDEFEAEAVTPPPRSERELGLTGPLVTAPSLPSHMARSGSAPPDAAPPAPSLPSAARLAPSLPDAAPPAPSLPSAARLAPSLPGSAPPASSLPSAARPAFAPPGVSRPAPASAGNGSFIPFDHPAFDSLPMVDFGDPDGQPPELDLDLIEQAPTPSWDGPAPALPGAGEELPLDEFASGAGAHQAGGLVDRQLAIAAAAPQAENEPDFASVLISRSVARVIFRFAVAKESGLLVLTGPEHAGRQAELLQWLHDVQVRAGMAVTPSDSAHRTYELHFVEGQPRLAAADRSEEALIAHLLCSDVLTSQRVEMALLTNPQRRPISALLAAGVLSPLQVSRYVVAFVLESIYESFSWGAGSYAFYRGREPSAESFPTGQDAIELIANGVARLAPELLERYFQQVRGSQLVANMQPPLYIEELHPDRVLLEVYRRLGYPQETQAALATCSMLGTPAQVMRALYLLLECDLVLFV